jgi:hypothetical protein
LDITITFGFWVEVNRVWGFDWIWGIVKVNGIRRVGEICKTRITFDTWKV